MRLWTVGIEHSRQAIELDPENDYYQEQLAKFSGETPDAM